MLESIEKEVDGLLFNPKQLKSALRNYVNTHNSGLKFKLTATFMLENWGTHVWKLDEGFLQNIGLRQSRKPELTQLASGKLFVNYKHGLGSHIYNHIDMSLGFIAY